LIREDALPKGSRARRQFTSVGDVRREMVALYWQLKEGGLVLPPGIAPTLARLLEGIGRSMMESEVEVRARELEGKLLELAALLREQGKEIPDWALAGLERKLPN
jgi:hypothetical protein